MSLWVHDIINPSIGILITSVQAVGFDDRHRFTDIKHDVSMPNRERGTEREELRGNLRGRGGREEQRDKMRERGGETRRLNAKLS